MLDTWFSSALWPFATLGWPDDTPELRAFYPTDVLVTARDIMFLWVARMIMMGLEFTGEIPFSDVYVHSIIQAPDGRRMSKSLGTGIDPLDLIEGGPRPPVFAKGGASPGDFPAYGADALRWGLLAMSSGQDVRFSEDKLAQGQQLTNKLWNAARLIILGVGGPDVRGPRRGPAQRARGSLDPVAPGARPGRPLGPDRALRLLPCRAGAVRLRLRRAVRLVPGAGQAAAARRRARAGRDLLHVLTETLALAHPLIPFETEEIYSHIPGTEGLLAARVHAKPAARDEQAERQIGNVIEAVQALRAWRDVPGSRPAGGPGQAPGARLRGHRRAPGAPGPAGSADGGR